MRSNGVGNVTAHLAEQVTHIEKVIVLLQGLVQEHFLHITYSLSLSYAIKVKVMTSSQYDKMIKSILWH